MFVALMWGAVGASALLVGALVAYAMTPSPTFIGVVMALGGGLLIGSVAFELVDEAIKETDVATVGLFTLVGAAIFTVGNWWLDRRGGGDRKDSEGAQASGSPLAIVFGSVLDGIPESFVLGLTAALGYVILDPASGRTGAFAQGFAAGALLAMVTDTLLPEAYQVERVATGALVAIGFSISLILSAL